MAYIYSLLKPETLIGQSLDFSFTNDTIEFIKYFMSLFVISYYYSSNAYLSQLINFSIFFNLVFLLIIDFNPFHNIAFAALTIKGLHKLSIFQDNIKTQYIKH